MEAAMKQLSILCLKALAVILSLCLLVGCTIDKSIDASEVDWREQPLTVNKEDAKKSIGDFVGSVAVYNDNGELYFVFAGLIEDLYHEESYATFTFEGNTYTYINYKIEIIR